jgi:hypothetical protein
MSDEIGDQRRRKLEDTIRQAAKELLSLSNFKGFSFPFGDGREIRLGVEVKPEILFDTPKGCLVVDGKECYSAEELWTTAWEAEKREGEDGMGGRSMTVGRYEEIQRRLAEGRGVA